MPVRRNHAAEDGDLRVHLDELGLYARDRDAAVLDRGRGP
jgi:hypothetical protein